MKAFITSQLSHCPLVWVFQSERLVKKIIALHERALRTTCGDKNFSINELLKRDNSVSIHRKNVQALATEMYKVSNNMSPTILNDVFASRATPYNLRNPVSFKMRKVYSVYKGTETLSHLGPKV